LEEVERRADKAHRRPARLGLCLGAGAAALLPVAGGVALADMGGVGSALPAAVAAIAIAAATVLAVEWTLARPLRQNIETLQAELETVHGKLA
jgi:hypothetical protein